MVAAAAKCSRNCVRNAFGALNYGVLVLLIVAVATTEGGVGWRRKIQPPPWHSSLFPPLRDLIEWRFVWALLFDCLLGFCFCYFSICFSPLCELNPIAPRQQSTHTHKAHTHTHTSYLCIYICSLCFCLCCITLNAFKQLADPAGRIAERAI